MSLRACSRSASGQTSYVMKYFGHAPAHNCARREVRPSVRCVRRARVSFQTNARPPVRRTQAVRHTNRFNKRRGRVVEPAGSLQLRDLGLHRQELRHAVGHHRKQGRRRRALRRAGGACRVRAGEREGGVLGHHGFVWLRSNGRLPTVRCALPAPPSARLRTRGGPALARARLSEHAQRGGGGRGATKATATQAVSAHPTACYES